MCSLLRGGMCLLKWQRLARSDQLIKRRGKAGLLKLNSTWEDAKQWIVERAGKPITVRSCLWSVAAAALSTFVRPQCQAQADLRLPVLPGRGHHWTSKQIRESDVDDG